MPRSKRHQARPPQEPQGDHRNSDSDPRGHSARPTADGPNVLQAPSHPSRPSASDGAEASASQRQRSDTDREHDDRSRVIELTDEQERGGEQEQQQATADHRCWPRADNPCSAVSWRGYARPPSHAGWNSGHWNLSGSRRVLLISGTPRGCCGERGTALGAKTVGGGYWRPTDMTSRRGLA